MGSSDPLVVSVADETKKMTVGDEKPEKYHVQIPVVIGFCPHDRR
jgi:hypothetical protein